MKRLLTFIDRFFFEKISASGFGLMRIAWAGTILVSMLGGASDVVRYYSGVGISPISFAPFVLRNAYRFSILDTIVTDPFPVLLLWSTLLWCLFCSMLGLRTRLMTFLSFVLLCSFHERNIYILNSGDSLLRLIGFLLVITPRIDAFSLDRLQQRSLAPITMSIWPYRLLLWQFIVLYLTSLWDKLQGVMWINGGVIASVFHHMDYFRFPKIVADLLSPFSFSLTAAFLVFELSWILLLIPRKIWRFALPGRMQNYSLKRCLLILGIFFHSGIFLFMNVGNYSFVIFAGYLGLLLAEDFDVLRNFFNTGWKRRNPTDDAKISVLYDGSCRLCQRSMFLLLSIDALHRLRAVDFRNPALLKKYAPDLTEKSLDRALHIRLPDGKTFAGFDAFRVLAKHLPALWITVPFLALPFVSPIGRRIYARIAGKRHACVQGSCAQK